VLAKRLKIGVRSEKDHWLDLDAGIYSYQGVFCEVGKTHNWILIFLGSCRGLSAKLSLIFFLRPDVAQGHRGGGGGPGGPGRRRLEWLGARVPREKGRGEQGDQDGVLTLGAERREDGPRRRTATASGGLTRRRCSGVGPVTGRG
jgi:hypothetical protein